jgi:glycosyltransferase involved in cell wall biosynthesis
MNAGTAPIAAGLRPIFSADAFTLQRRGGVSRYFAELHRALTASGIDSEVAAPLWISEHLEPGPGVMGLRLPAIADRRGAGRMCRRVGATAERRSVDAAGPDGVVLHRTYYSLRPTPGTVPVVETVFDMIHEDHPGLTAVRDRAAEWKRASLARADQVITISEHTRRRLLAHYDLDPGRVTTVHLGVRDMPVDRQAVESLRASDPFILYVGAREAYKNFDRFLEASAAVVDVHDQLRVRVFGGPPPTVAERATIKRLGLTRSVDFVGGSDADLAASYAAATVFVYPSVDEGFGLPPLEAMTQRCAVASSTGGSMPEVLANAAAFFDPADTVDMARTIAELVDRPGLRAELAERGARRARAFRWDRVAAETVAVYERAVAERAPAQVPTT